ncbi:unnamed protein product [Linum trigynum]|uniref:Pentatricopeptide repeat-containing protein n=1 Tax=Linum trigynum TaxID=586398 RepID=A0AAV2D5Q0_9ROSI
MHHRRLQLIQHFSPSISGLFKASNSSTCLTHTLAISSQWVDETRVSRLESASNNSVLELLISGKGNKFMPSAYSMDYSIMGCWGQRYWGLKTCGGLNNVALGKLIQDDVFDMGFDLDMYMGRSLVKLYAENGHLQDARVLFDRMSQKDCVLWNVMLGSFSKYGESGSALKAFNEMRNSGIKPNAVTFACVLSVCSADAMIRFGSSIHGLVVTSGLQYDPHVANTLVSMYSKCRRLADARKLFDKISQTDLVKWNGMMAGMVQHGLMEEASNLFREMISAGENESKLPYNGKRLPACAGLVALKLGKELHGKILKDGLVLEGNVHLESAVMDMYAKCGRLDLAHQIFRRMRVKDVVCWNSIITSCTQNCKPEEAIELFRQTGKEEGLTYNQVSISAALSACTDLSSLHYGKQIHSILVKGTVACDVFAQSALVDMYAKCGHLKLARCMFDNMEIKNEVSWNSIIAAYANHGFLDETLALFHGMFEQGIHPDHVTFLAVISACAHAGQVDDGIRYFRYMTEEFKFPAKMQHYACLVDMFGRAGQLYEAFGVIKSMPFQPDAGVWGTLLGASRVHGNVELAKVASSYLLELDPSNSGYYVLLANVHADASQWKSMRCEPLIQVCFSQWYIRI